MTYYKKKYKLKDKNYINAIKYSKSVLSLPVYPKLKTNEIDFICKTLKEI